MSAEQLGSIEVLSSLEKPELKVEFEKREVARVFVLQSLSAEQINQELEKALANSIGSDVDLIEIVTKLPLTHCLWLEKGSTARNKGQVMPIGGGVEPEDLGDLARTASRELLQETHLRPIKLEQLRTMDEADKPITIEYKMKLKDEDSITEVDNTQYLYVATILPSDVPYQLDPAEDKIAEFPGLSLSEMGLLWSEDKLSKNDRSLVLLDSLRLFPENVNNPKIDLEFKKTEEHALAVAEVMRSLGAKVREFKIQKMADVAAELISILEWRMKEAYNLAEPEIEQRTLPALALIEQLKVLGDNLPEAEKIYAQVIGLTRDYVDLKDWFPHAVERSNFREELKNPGNSNIEAAIRLAFLLTKTALSLNEIADLQQKQQAETGQENFNEYYDLIGFLQRISGVVKIDDLTDKLIADFANLKSRRQIDSEVSTRTGITDIGTKFNRINKFLENMVDLGLVKGSQGALEPGQVNMLTNVTNTDLRSLLRYAFDFTSDDINVEKFQTKESRERLQFEALRKLFLLSALEPANQRYREVEDLSNHDIEELWGNLFVVNKRSQRSVVSDVGDDGNEAEWFMRGFQDIPGLLAMQDSRTKQVSSYYRKIIVRGFDDPEQLWDIYGRSLVLSPDSGSDQKVQTELFTRIEAQVEVYSADKKNNLSPETKTVLEFPAVLKIIAELQKQGAKIVDYDATNLPGTKFNSAGPGGGDDIVLAKFYICLDTEEDGEQQRRFEEVQIFSPTEDGVSGFAHKEHKAQSDAQYTVKRLTDTKGLRSFIELMFPAGIYGDPMHVPYRKNGNGNGHK